MSILPIDWSLDESGTEVPLKATPVALSRMDEVTARGREVDTHLRAWMVAVLAFIFIGLNVGMGLMLYSAFLTDVTHLTAHLIKPDERLITEKTFMTLIGATVVQVGFGIAAVVAYLFPKHREPGDKAQSSVGPMQ